MFYCIDGSSNYAGWRPLVTKEQASLHADWLCSSTLRVLLALEPGTTTYSQCYRTNAVVYAIHYVPWDRYSKYDMISLILVKCRRNTFRLNNFIHPWKWSRFQNYLDHYSFTLFELYSIVSCHVWNLTTHILTDSVGGKTTVEMTKIVHFSMRRLQKKNESLLIPKTSHGAQN